MRRDGAGTVNSEEMVPMRYIKLALCAIIATVLQSTVFSHLAVKGIGPDLVLLMAVVFGLLGGWKIGATHAIIGGTIEGLMLGQAVGIRVFSLLIAGISAGVISTKVDKDSLLTLMTAVLLATTINSVIGFASMLAIGVEISARYVCMEMVLPKVVYNISIAVVFRCMLYRLYFSITSEESDILQLV